MGGQREAWKSVAGFSGGQALRWPGERIQEKAEIFLEHWLCRERHTWRKRQCQAPPPPARKGVAPPEESGPTAGTSGLRGGAGWASVSHGKGRGQGAGEAPKVLSPGSGAAAAPRAQPPTRSQAVGRQVVLHHFKMLTSCSVLRPQ